MHKLLVLNGNVFHYELTIQELLLCIYINELSILIIRVIIDLSEGFVKENNL
jgi:hypothetical protein